MPNIGMVTTPLKELNPRNELPLESENPLPRWLREAHLRWRPTDAILLAPSLQPRTLHVYTCSRLLKYPKVASYAGRLVDLGPEAALTAPAWSSATIPAPQWQTAARLCEVHPQTALPGKSRTEKVELRCVLLAQDARRQAGVPGEPQSRALLRCRLWALQSRGSGVLSSPPHKKEADAVWDRG